jgi:membrane protein implicated in regulation of membrane protease activity
MGNHRGERPGVHRPTGGRSAELAFLGLVNLILGVLLLVAATIWDNAPLPTDVQSGFWPGILFFASVPVLAVVIVLVQRRRARREQVVAGRGRRAKRD